MACTPTTGSDSASSRAGQVGKGGADCVAAGELVDGEDGGREDCGGEEDGEGVQCGREEV